MKETIEYILDNKIIMIVRGVPTDRLVPLAEAMWRGGVRVMECTYDASGKIPDEITAEGIELLSKHFEGRMIIGAGTVLKKSQIELTKASGFFVPFFHSANLADAKRQKRRVGGIPT